MHDVPARGLPFVPPGRGSRGPPVFVRRHPAGVTVKLRRNHVHVDLPGMRARSSPGLQRMPRLRRQDRSSRHSATVPGGRTGATAPPPRPAAQPPPPPPPQAAAPPRQPYAPPQAVYDPPRQAAPRPRPAGPALPTWLLGVLFSLAFLGLV